VSDFSAPSLEELERQLPNGLHDSDVLALTHDYVRATVTLELKLWVAESLEDTDDHYRPARLTIHGVALLCIEPPESGYDFDGPGALDLLGASPLAMLKRPPPPLPPIPPDCFCNALYINTWNAHVIVAARSVTLDWTGEPEVGRA
jgi:hypothetical protein